MNSSIYKLYNKLLINLLYNYNLSDSLKAKNNKLKIIKICKDGIEHGILIGEISFSQQSKFFPKSLKSWSFYSLSLLSNILQRLLKA